MYQYSCNAGEYPEDWPEDGAKMHPTRLLRELREAQICRMYGPNVHYDYLDALPDIGRLEVLRSRDDVIAVGKQLHNCAASYAKYVQNEKGVLVALRGQNGKAIALGWLRFNEFCHVEPGSLPEWGQIYEACNQSPSAEIVDTYRAYTSTVRNWYETVFVQAKTKDDDNV